MINFINKFAKTRRSEKREKSDKASSSSSDLRLDQKLTFVSQGERWTFEEGNKVFFEGEDVNSMIDEDRDNVRLLCGLSQGLSEYQRFVWTNGGKNNANFNAMMNALQDKVHIRLSDIYENMTGGVAFEYSNGEFWINNINVRKVIRLFYMRPTEKARKYLISLRNKLNLILSQRTFSKRYDAVHDEAKSIFKDINLALEYIPADAPPRLVSHLRDI